MKKVTITGSIRRMFENRSFNQETKKMESVYTGRIKGFTCSDNAIDIDHDFEFSPALNRVAKGIRRALIGDGIGISLGSHSVKFIIELTESQSNGITGRVVSIML